MDCGGKIMECIKKERISEAEEVFDPMAKKGVNLNISVYKAMIKGHSQARNTRRILKLLDEMQDRGLKRDADVFNAAIQSWPIDEDVKVLLTLFETMKNEHGLIPDPYTYDYLLEKCAKAEDLEAARRVFGEMLSSGVNTYCTKMYTMIKTYSKCCTEDTAAQCLEDCRELIESERRIGRNACKATYKMVLKICVQGCLAKEAMDLLNEMKHKSMLVDRETIHIALQACSRAGDLDNALRLLDKIKGRLFYRADKYTYKLVLKACVSNKDLKMVKCIFEEMCTFGGEDNVVLSMILDAYAECCDTKNARECLKESQEVINKIKDKGVQPDLSAYNTLLKTCARGGLTNEALNILEEMKAKELSPNTVSYSIIISGISNDKAYQIKRFKSCLWNCWRRFRRKKFN